MTSASLPMPRHAPVETKPMILGLTGPFACGKTTIADRIEREMLFDKPKTATSRPPRPDDKDRYHYHPPEFFHTSGYFLETAINHGHMYGTPRHEIYGRLSQGKNIVICLDPQGIRSLMRDRDSAIRESLISIYIEVSLQEAVGRYLCREHVFSREDLVNRMATREREEQMKHLCQYRIPNQNGGLEATVDKIKNILLHRAKELQTFV